MFVLLTRNVGLLPPHGLAKLTNRFVSKATMTTHRAERKRLRQQNLIETHISNVLYTCPKNANSTSLWNEAQFWNNQTECAVFMTRI